MDARHGHRWLVVVVVAWLAGGTAWHAQSPTRLSIVIVVDGLRPDQVTADQMPRLARAGRPRRTLRRPSRRLPDGDAGQRGHLRHRRDAGAARPARQLDLHPVGRSGAAHRHRRSRGAAEGGGGGRAAAHRADHRSDAGAGRQALPGGQFGIVGLGPAPQSDAGCRDDPAHRVRASRGVARQGGRDARTHAGGRATQRRRATATPPTCCCGSACPRSGPTSCSCGTATQIPPPTPAGSTPPRPAPRSPRWTGRSAGSKTGYGLRAGSTPPTSW